MYVITVIAGMIRYRRPLLEPTGNEDLYTLAAIFGAAAGAALTAAITTEAVGYVFLLIPNRIREIKEEGRREARAEAVREGRLEGREKGRAEGRREGRLEGRKEARREIRSQIARLCARYKKGEITLDEFFKRISDVLDDRCDVCGRSG